MFDSLDIFPFLIQLFSLNIKNMMVVFPIQCLAKQQKKHVCQILCIFNLESESLLLRVCYGLYWIDSFGLFESV